MTVIEDRVIEPGGHWGRVIANGQTLRIVDLEGQQAVDFLCYNAARPEERYNAADTMKYAGSIYIAKGVSGLATVFPGACASELDADYAACLGRRVACRFCQEIVMADGVIAPLDCDVSDDGVVNGSCP